MLNRRHLRIKVLQSLYAWFQQEEPDFAKGEKELMISINRIFDLYIYYFTLLRELVSAAENRIEEQRSKKLPGREKPEQHLKFVNNYVLQAILNSPAITTEASKRKISWMKEQELVRKLFTEIRNSETYQEYISQSDSSKTKDVQFTEWLFKDKIANSEQVLHFFEEKSISWLDDIDLVCSSVLKNIKSLEAEKELKLFPLFKDEKEDILFVRELFKQTLVQSIANEELISSKADNWELERIATMDMILMKMAITEVRVFPTIPVKVTLNEYIEISKFYSTPKSNGFINGILDKVFAELKKNGTIKKVGRGLIEE